MRLSEAIRLGVGLSCDTPEQRTRTLATIACLIDKATDSLDATGELTPEQMTAYDKIADFIAELRGIETCDQCNADGGICYLCNKPICTTCGCGCA